MEEWKKWKSIKYPNIRYDSHHAEVVDLCTGEVLNDNMYVSHWDEIDSPHNHLSHPND